MMYIHLTACGKKNVFFYMTVGNVLSRNIILGVRGKTLWKHTSITYRRLKKMDHWQEEEGRQVADRQPDDIGSALLLGAFLVFVVHYRAHGSSLECFHRTGWVK